MGTRAVGIVSIVLSLAACGPNVPQTTSTLNDDAITVASFEFPESMVLGEIYAQALEAEGFDVERQLGIGPRELVEPSLERGLVELVPEYAGSALEFLAGGENIATSDEELTHARLVDAFAERGVDVLTPAPAQNQNGFAVAQKTAKRNGLEAISDLTAIDEDLAFGGPPECPERPLCLDGLESTYGLEFDRFVTLDAGGPLTVSALQAGTVDVALLFTTDAAIQENDFVLLEDDRGLQPAENVTPVVRDEVIERHGDRFVGVVDAVSRLITTAELRALNASVALEDASPERVAATWLAEHGLLDARD
ncbi:MAG TPA: ABC transporter substrate-binding protein [Actinomycetota bacterium]|jgi:osmoprotectant transport system substrate-binding protein|nr:ABC transporter substrate-binding protein [Actinomycetota bacterium]